MAELETKASSEPGFHIDQQVDLVEYLYAVLRYKFRIVIVAILGAGAVFGLSLSVEDRFSAEAVVAVNINENPGGVAPKSYRGSDTLSLLEHDFIIDPNTGNELDRMLARVNSYAFGEHFIETYDLLPWLFRSHWDSEAEVWLGDFKPDMREAVKLLKTSRLYFEMDDATGLLKVGMNAQDPAQAADLVNKFVPLFNEYIRENELNELNQRRAYLEQRLSEVNNIELHRSIFRLLETQLAVESLLFARANYPLEMIQPATVPLYKSYPSRKKWAVLALFGLVMLGVMAVIGLVIIRKLRAGLKRYEFASQSDPSNPPKRQSGSRDQPQGAVPEQNKDRSNWVDD